LFHARPFSFQAVQVHDAIVIFIDFETTGLDVAHDRIVEIGALSASGVFATVVCPGITSESAVHGIDGAELAEGPTFPSYGRRRVVPRPVLSEKTQIAEPDIRKKSCVCENMCKNT
jgi:hypothetical protein